MLSRGDVWVFVSNPLTLSLLGFALLVLLSAVLPTIARRREVLVGEE